MDVWVRIFLLDHANLLLPDGVGSLFKLGIYFFKFVTVRGKTTAARVNGKDPFELVARNELFYQVVIKANSLAVLLDSHSADIPVLHGQSLLALDDHVHLSALLDAKLKDLKSVLDHVVLDFIVKVGVRPETWHVVHLKHPGLQLMVQHHIEAEQVAANIRLLGLTGAIQVLELRLHNHERLDNYLLDLVPNLIGFLSVGAAIGSC